MAVVNGTDNADLLDGNGDAMSAGDDIAFGKDGDDIIKGLGGADELFGQKGNDIIAGGSGEDVLDGGKGKDQLFGGIDDDKLIGGKGKDKLNGGLGNDNLKGGNKSDKYGFNTELNEATNVDKIKGFEVDSDIIGLHVDIFSEIGGKLNKSEFRKGSSAKDGNDYILYNNGKLFYDHDADGGDSKVQFAKLKGNPNGLDHNDFDVFG
ncbi:MAG: calcium-binding protein [Hyphomicrobiales bacterium]|nr:calcium-binding protein [Hyphomicrobiales bacterium]